MTALMSDSTVSIQRRISIIRCYETNDTVGGTMSDEQPVQLSNKQSDNELCVSGYVSTTISVAVTGGL